MAIPLAKLSGCGGFPWFEKVTYNDWFLAQSVQSVYKFSCSKFAVWPDFGKNSQNISKVTLPKKPQQFFHKKWCISNSSKIGQFLWLLLRENLSKEFEKSPNLVTLSANAKGSFVWLNGAAIRYSPQSFCPIEIAVNLEATASRLLWICRCLYALSRGHF